MIMKSLRKCVGLRGQYLPGSTSRHSFSNTACARSQQLSKAGCAF